MTSWGLSCSAQKEWGHSAGPTALWMFPPACTKSWLRDDSGVYLTSVHKRKKSICIHVEYAPATLSNPDEYNASWQDVQCFRLLDFSLFQSASSSHFKKF
jgi:hypothetical protein